MYPLLLNTLNTGNTIRTLAPCNAYNTCHNNVISVVGISIITNNNNEVQAQGQQQQGVGQTKISELWESPADLKNPESVVYASKQDVLFVSNIDGKPDQKDQNGFISKVSPTNGSIIELDWIKGLNTPKGMAI